MEQNEALFIQLREAKDALNPVVSPLNFAPPRLATEAPGLATPPTPEAHWCSLIPDNDPTDPRPEFDPALGWNTLLVLEWGVRQQQKGGE